MTAEGLPVVDPPADAPDADVGGLLLAAGTSSRFGDRNKLLEAVAGEPIVRRAARTLLAADLDPVVAVLGHERDRVAEALADLPVETVDNPEYAAGQSTSVRAGIEALRARDVEAAAIALGDMPFVDARTVAALVAAYAAGEGNALAAAYDGERGNPVLFDRRFFDSLADVAGDIGGREILLGSNDAALVAVDDPGVRRDIDEPGDLGG